MNDSTIIYIWSEKMRSFTPVYAYKIVCSICSTSYDGMAWDRTCGGEAFLQCECGEQYFTTRE